MKYYYTFVNELGIRDIGCKEAVSNTDLQKTITSLNLCSTGGYTEDSFLSARPTGNFKNDCFTTLPTSSFAVFVRKKYRTYNEVDGILRCYGSHYLGRCLIAAAMIFVTFMWTIMAQYSDSSGVPVYLLIILFMLAGFLTLSVSNEMIVDPGQKRITLRKHLYFMQLKENCLDLHGANTVHLKSGLQFGTADIVQSKLFLL